jgi:flagellar basal-body rod modification protein FlgD
MMPTVSTLSSPAASGSAAAAQSSSTTSTATQPVDENMFLQLLVAQLQNQDPLNPTDGTAFVTQLAQFQQLEQSINTGQDVTAIHQDLDKIVTDLGSGTVSQS